MSSANIRKIGSLIVTVVVSIVIIKVFWEQPLVISSLGICLGLGLGMMRAQ